MYRFLINEPLFEDVIIEHAEFDPLGSGAYGLIHGPPVREVEGPTYDRALLTDGVYDPNLEGWRYKFQCKQPGEIWVFSGIGYFESVFDDDPVTGIPFPYIVTAFGSLNAWCSFIIRPPEV